MSSQNIVSQRALDVIRYPDPLLSYTAKVNQNAYDPITNTQGIINIGLAENMLCEDLLLKKINELTKLEVKSKDLYYFTNHGNDSFRKTIKNVIKKWFNPSNPIHKDNIITVTGVTCLLDMLAFSLAEAGDYFLCPTPYYSRIRNDFFDKSHVNIFDFPIKENSPDGGIVYRITEEKLEKAYKAAIQQGHNVKGILIINPNNPTGEVLSREEITSILKFSNQKSLHAVFDEIYAFSIHDDKTKFTSVLTVPFLDKERTHFLWGLSKDLALSGFRCGVLYTANEEVLAYIRKSAAYSAIPSRIQVLLTALLSDFDWLENEYLPQNRMRMKKSYEMATSRLRNLGVTTYPSKGGFFVWANFSKFMKEQSVQGEQDLFMSFFDNKIFISGGTSFYSEEPGWFRIIFTVDVGILQVALDRIEQIIKPIPWSSPLHSIIGCDK